MADFRSWGGKNLALQKTITAQKAAYEATRKHDAQAEAKIERASFRDQETRNQHLKSKLGSYEDYAQSHANLAPEDYDKLRSTDKETNPTQTKPKPNVPSLVTIPKYRKNQHLKTRTKGKEKG